MTPSDESAHRADRHRGRFLLASSPDRGPEGSTHHRRAGWSLAVRDLPVPDLPDRQGGQVNRFTGVRGTASRVVPKAQRIVRGMRGDLVTSTAPAA